MDSQSRFYVVMKRKGGPTVYGEWGPVSFAIAERRPGKADLIPAAADVDGPDDSAYDMAKGGNRYVIKPNPDVSVRTGDKVYGTGELSRPPRELLVLSKSPGFVGLGLYGYNYGFDEKAWRSQQVVIIVSKSGKVTHFKTLVDLFSVEVLRGFEITAGGINWLHSGWLDEDRHEVVVTGGGDLFTDFLDPPSQLG